MGPLTALITIISNLLFAAPAAADCVRTGATVTCTGVTLGSSITRDAVDLTVTQGSFVLNIPDPEMFGSCPLSPPAISVGRNSRVTNRGLVTGFGTCGSGIVADDGSTVFNIGKIVTIDSVAHGIDVGDGSTISVTGEINTSGAVSYGVFAAQSVRVTTGPLSIIETTGLAAHGISVGNGGSIETNGTVQVAGQLANALELAGSGSIVNSGAVRATGRSGIGIRADGANVTVSNSGQIFASSANAISTETGAIGIDATGAQIEIRNTGTIDGQQAAIRVAPSISATVQNSGTLRLLGVGAIIAANTAAGAEVDITNTGTILGDVAIAGGAGIERLTNSGFIFGDIRLGAGNDSLSLITPVSSFIDMGDGIDSVSLLGSGTISRPLINAETVTKFNAGTWTILNSISTQTMNVIDGTLQLGPFGRISAAIVNVIGTGKLTAGGASSVVGHVRNEATLDIGNMVIFGDYRQTATGTLRVVLRPQRSAPLVVGGNVTLGGTLDPDFAEGPVQGGETFPLIALSPQSTFDGQFARIVGLTPFFLRGTTERSADGMLLSLRVERLPFTAAATTPRQRDVAAALDAAKARGATGLNNLFATIEPMTAAQAAASFESLAPAVPVAAATSAALSMRAGLRTIGNALQSDDPAPGETRAWGTLSRHWGRSSGDDPAANYGFKGTQVVAGFDHGLSNGTRIGVAFAADDGDITGRRDNGNADSDVRSLSIYAAHPIGSWRLSGALSLGDGNTEWQRAGLLGPTGGKADIDLAGGFIAAGYALSAGPFDIEPRLALNVESTRMGGATETGGSELVLTGQRETWLRPEAGVRLTSGSGRVRPYLSVAASYASERPDLTLAAAFRSDPTTRFALRGPGLKRWWLTTEAGAAFDIAPGLSARIGFDGVVNDPLAHRGVVLGLSYVW